MGTVVTVLFSSFALPLIDSEFEKEQGKWLRMGQQYLESNEYDDAIYCAQQVFKQPIVKSTKYDNILHDACRLASNAFDNKSEGKEALAYARKARDVYKFKSFCGTCTASHEKELHDEIKSLKKKYGLPDHASDFRSRNRNGTSASLGSAFGILNLISSRTFTLLGMLLFALCVFKIHRFRQLDTEERKLDSK